MKTELKAIEIESQKTDENEYSVYDYLKKTPSVFVALISSIVAIVTFFAKWITIISIRKEILFWGINADHLNFENESMAFVATIAITYSFVSMLIAIWFLATYEAYLPHAKLLMTVDFIKKTVSNEIKVIKRKIKKGKYSEDEDEYLSSYKELCLLQKEVRKNTLKEFAKNVIPIIFVICINTYFFLAVITDNYENFLFAGFASTLVQTLIFYIMSKFNTSRSIKKKEIKAKCMDPEFLLQQRIGIDEEYPIARLFSKGIRSIMKNSTITLIAITLIFNSCFTVIAFALTENNPIGKNKQFQTLTIDGIYYVIVYQNGNQYFLEVAERITKVTEDGEEIEVLIIYSNRQRIQTTNEIVLEVKEFDEIIKKHKH